MNPSPIATRLFSLQVSPRPEDAKELAYLEEYIAWKAAGGVDIHDHKRAKEKVNQGRNYDRIMRYKAKRK